MKKIASLLVILALLCGAALAETVNVTITNNQGEICLAWAPVEVSDVDEDGVLSLYDALYCAHETYYDGGAEAGFGAEDQGYGPSLTKLWGEDNGGSLGYCFNNAPAMSLADPISADGHVHAYAYQDLETWSDQFSYFQYTDKTALRLTLSALGFDADWNPVASPLAGAAITLDGEDTGLVTDEEGVVDLSELTISEPGDHIVSAIYTDAVIVPPVFKITVSE